MGSGSKMKKALIIGITGQDGHYLSEFLSSKDYAVHRLIRGIDITAEGSLATDFEELQPDEVYNLSGRLHLPDVWKFPITSAKVNALAPLNILETIRLKCPKARFFQASSSEMFGAVEEWPQRETTPFKPRNPYGTAKAFAHETVKLYRETYKLFACSGILYNHESPRRSMQFVSRKITYEVARIKRGVSDKLELGNIFARRDRGFAGDYVKAMWLMLQAEKPQDYIIATGKSYTVEYMAKVAFESVGLDYKKYLVTNPNLLWVNDDDNLVGDITKIKTELGWEPEMSFEKMIGLMVENDLQGSVNNK